jgi:hypothetical protein
MRPANSWRRIDIRQPTKHPHRVRVTIHPAKGIKKGKKSAIFLPIWVIADFLDGVSNFLINNRMRYLRLVGILSICILIGILWPLKEGLAINSRPVLLNPDSLASASVPNETLKPRYQIPGDFVPNEDIRVPTHASGHSRTASYDSWRYGPAPGQQGIYEVVVPSDWIVSPARFLRDVPANWPSGSIQPDVY